MPWLDSSAIASRVFCRLMPMPVTAAMCSLSADAMIWSTAVRQCSALEPKFASSSLTPVVSGRGHAAAIAPWTSCRMKSIGVLSTSGSGVRFSSTTTVL